MGALQIYIDIDVDVKEVHRAIKEKVTSRRLAAAISRTNASLTSVDGIVRQRCEVVVTLLQDCSTVAILQQQKPDLHADVAFRDNWRFHSTADFSIRVRLNS